MESFPPIEDQKEKKSEERFVRVSVRSIMYVALLVVLGFILYALKDLLFVFLTAIVIASFVEGGVRSLRKRGIGRTISVIIIYFCTLAIFGVLFYFFVPVFLGEMAQFADLIHLYLPGTGSLHGAVPFADVFTNLDVIATSATSATSGVIQIALIMFGGLFNFLLLVVLSFYLSINEGGIETFLRIVSPRRKAQYVVGLWKRTEHKIGLWFQGQLLLGLLVGVLTYAGLLAFKIKYALVLALVAGVLELVPFGIVLAAIPAIVAGYGLYGATGAIQVAVLYTIIQQLESNIIQPLIIRKIVGVSSLIVILSLLVGVKLAGFWGVILAIPAAVLLMEFLNDVQKQKGLIPES